MMRLEGILTKDKLKDLVAGQYILYSGTIYTARDQAHKRIVDSIKNKKAIPIDIKNKIIYYSGPTPIIKNDAVGAAGPTTSSRMDHFTPVLLKAGMTACIGKGSRSKEIVSAFKKYQCVYFLAISGAGAYLAKKIERIDIVGYKDLGAEAIYRMEVKDFPLIVGVDSRGMDIYG